MGRVNPEENMQVFIDNMRDRSYDFRGKLHAQMGNDQLEELLILDGVYVGREGYRMHADVHLPGFESEGSILRTDDQLYYKLSSEQKWKPTTEQDLRMLGITYKESPADLLESMKDMVIAVKPTNEPNVYRVVLDRDKYEQKAETEGVLRLPQVNIQAHDFHIHLLENPIVDVEVDLARHVIRSLTLSYELEAAVSDTETERMNVTYEMEIDNVDTGQTLPEL